MFRIVEKRGTKVGGGYHVTLRQARNELPYVETSSRSLVPDTDTDFQSPRRPILRTLEQKINKAYKNKYNNSTWENPGTITWFPTEIDTLQNE